MQCHSIKRKIDAALADPESLREKLFGVFRPIAMDDHTQATPETP